MAWWPTTAACAHSRTTNLTFEQHSTHPQQHSTHPHCSDQDRIMNKLTKTYQTKQRLARALGRGEQQQAPRGRRRAGWHGDRGRARGGGDDRRRAGWRRRPRCGGPSGVGAGERNRRRTQGRRWQWYIYATPLYSRCHPPTGSKGLPLLPVGNKHRE